MAKLFGRLWGRLVWLVYEFPKSLIESTWVRRFWKAGRFAILKAYVARPALVTLVVMGVIQALLFDFGAGVQRWLSWRLWLEAFLGLNLFLNSPAGRSVEERVLDICVRGLARAAVPNLCRHLPFGDDLFHDVMQWIEQSLYTVDEWMRFPQRGPASVCPGEDSAGVGLVGLLVCAAAGDHAAGGTTDQPDQTLPGRDRLAQDPAAVRPSAAHDHS